MVEIQPAPPNPGTNGRGYETTFIAAIKKVECEPEDVALMQLGLRYAQMMDRMAGSAAEVESMTVIAPKYAAILDALCMSPKSRAVARQRAPQKAETPRPTSRKDVLKDELRQRREGRRAV